MKIQLSDHFNYRRLLRFTIPSIIMMIFTSIYSVVDGIFVTNFVGKAQFTAINLIMPLVQILGSLGFMFGTGGSALVAKTLGEKDEKKANNIFSLLTYTTILLGVILVAIGVPLLPNLVTLLGAEGVTAEYCITYGRILFISLPAFMLQNMFQSLLIAAERPKIGLGVTIAAGVTNMVLDALFIVVFDWGIAGAAIATTIAQYVGGGIPFIFFVRKNGSALRLGKAKFDGRALLKSCANGSSELVSNVSMAVVSMLYNFQLLRFDPENGVAAYGAVMYAGFIFVAIFIGYAVGVAPVVSYHYGAKNRSELKGLLKKSNILVIGTSVVIAVLAFTLAGPLAMIFSGGDQVLKSLTTTAFRYYAGAVLFSGFCIFGSSFFTALNDGVTSAIISFLRTLVFQCSAVLILPIFFGINGVWSSLIVADFLAATVTAVCYIVRRKKYDY